MLFHTTEFLLFFSLLYGALHFVKARRLPRLWLLLGASYFFYGSWNPKYLGLIVLSTVIDYTLGLGIASSRSPARRKLLLTTSVVANLTILGVFKYYNFFIDSAVLLLHSLGFEAAVPHLSVLLPVGISFYTFQTMSYTIDLYRGRIEATRSLLEFAVFVAFFPQLVAGPIVRASTFLPQLQGVPRVTRSDFYGGLFLFAGGVFKKVVIADLLAVLFVDSVFENPSSFSGLDLLLATYGYAFQIYNDFSAYSDMAIGLALMLGFTLPDNFDHPYLSRDIREFWTRWHISLSTWLRDYLYIPLGGSRGRAPYLTYRNIAITMLLGGLWHGAGWTFVIWGAWHGLLIVVSHARSAFDPGSTAKARSELSNWARRLWTFHLVCLGWILFRASDLSAAWTVMRRIFLWAGGESSVPPVYLGILLMAVVLHVAGAVNLKPRLLARFVVSPMWTRSALAVAVVFLILTLGGKVDAFIYFQF